MDDGFAVWMRLAERADNSLTASSTIKPRSVGAIRLRQYIDKLKYQGMTPEKFGLWMQPPVHKRKVQRWLSGHSRPSHDEARQIKEKTKIPPDDWARYRQAAD